MDESEEQESKYEHGKDLDLDKFCEDVKDEDDDGLGLDLIDGNRF